MDRSCTRGATSRIRVCELDAGYACRPSSGGVLARLAAAARSGCAALCVRAWAARVVGERKRMIPE
eukprot:6213363-Pleurochrysis_carterae.AAC.2